MHAFSRACLLALLLPLFGTVASAAEVQSFSYVEPFGIPHTREILAFNLAKPVDGTKCRLLDANGKEAPFQISGNGKQLLLRTDLAAREKLSWRLVDGKPSAGEQTDVKVSEDAAHGWYEVSNGLTGVRVPTGKTFTDETAGLDPKEVADAAQGDWRLNEVKKKHNLVPVNPAPVQGLLLRDGRWTAQGPNLLNANALDSGMKVEFLERGPLETVIRVSYQFAGKPAIARNQQYPERNPGYPGGDGHYTCTITVAADQPTIQFEEDADVIVRWNMNLWPELNFDTVRHPDGGPNAIKTTDTPATPESIGKLISANFGGLRPWGDHPYDNYYDVLFDSKGNDASPIVGVFVDKSGDAVNPMASGVQVALNDNWLGRGQRGGGFNMVTWMSWPDARVWNHIHQRWGLYVDTKGQGLPPADKAQPILQQMDVLSGQAVRLRNVTEKIPQLPQLNWEERSDWVNVKTKFGAKGDGVADDTAALQAAIDSLKDGYNSPNTLYLPAGTYRITSTLHWQKLYSKHLLGNGRDTRIRWDGAGGGTDTPSVMFHSDGATAGVVFEGLVWDGAGKAVIGVDHCSSTHYETHIIHRNEEFINMGTGIFSGSSPWFKYVNASAEILFDNCLFVNSGNGVVFLSYNALDNTVVNCGFYYCGMGIRNVTGNVYVRDCHFAGDLDTDIWSHVGDTSALRCTSVGGHRFLHNSGQTFVMQDCHIDGWSSPKGAVDMAVGAPLTMFDSTFTNPPTRQAPLQAPMPYGGNANHAVLISNCTSEGTDGLLDKTFTERPVLIPPGKIGAAVSSPRQEFFRGEVAIPGKVFDARRDFGAKGDGRADDTDAIIATIKAAREYGKGAIAYLPCGQYLVKKTIEIFGDHYYVGGAGMGWTAGTLLEWGGPRPANGGEVALFHIKNAKDVTLQGFVAATPSVYYEDAGVISFFQEASDAPSMVTYDDVAGFTQFRGLGKNDRVFLKMLGGIIDFDNCQRATILAEQLYPSRHPQSQRFDTTLRVHGKDQTLPKDGFLGIMTMFNAGNPYDIKVQDSQSLIISDYYTEQTWRVLLLEGNAGDTPGQVTILTHKFHGEHVDDLVNVNNYRGALYLGASPIPQVPVTDPAEAAKIDGGTMAGVKVKWAPCVFTQTGANPVDIMLVGCSYMLEPVLKKEAGGNYILANDTAPGHPNPWHATVTVEEQGKISAALDQLRLLGMMDMTFKGLLPAH